MSPSRGSPPPYDTAAARVVYIFVVTWALDTGCYVTGRWLGGPKLAPRISPNKTFGGAAGGVVWATAASVICAVLLRILPAFDAIVLGVCIGLFGQIGDLWESSIKRELGIKDFGGILPGHGGALDRFDSLFLSLPIAVLYFGAFHP